MKRLTLRNIGQIREADLHFGDLTVLVGPQASGKSISLQWLKLLADTSLIQRQMKTYGLDYDGSLPQFLDVYFGEGMHSIWNSESAIQVDGKAWNTEWRIGRMQAEKPESAFFHSGAASDCIDQRLAQAIPGLQRRRSVYGAGLQRRLALADGT